MTRKPKSDPTCSGAPGWPSREMRARAGHGDASGRAAAQADRRGDDADEAWVAALLAARTAARVADEEDLAEADGEDFGGDDYDGDYGDVGDYGGGGYGGGYGDDEYGGGGDPTPAWRRSSPSTTAEFVNQDDAPAGVGFFDADRDADQQKVYEEVAGAALRLPLRAGHRRGGLDRRQAAARRCSPTRRRARHGGVDKKARLRPGSTPRR